MLFFSIKNDISCCASCGFLASSFTEFAPEKFVDAELPVARLNVEDEIESDVRFHALTRLLGGDSEKALGMCIRFWRMAQHFWGDEKALVPENQFKLCAFDLLLDVDLAVRREGGIYCRGAEDRFDWYLQKCRASRAAAAKKKAEREAKEIRDRGPEPVPRKTGEAPPVYRGSNSGPPEPVPRITGATAAEHPPVPAPAPARVRENNTTPCSPPAAPRDRELTQWAKDAASHATATARICLKAYLDKNSETLDPERAEKALGPRTWALVRKGFDSWKQFVNEYDRRRERHEDDFFKQAVADTFRALLPEVIAELATGREPTGPPGGAEQGGAELE